MQRRLAVILSALLLTGAQSALAEPSQTSFHEEAYREAVRRAAIKTPELTSRCGSQQLTMTCLRSL